MQTQKATLPVDNPTPHPSGTASSSKNRAKRPSLVMQPLQGCFAIAALVVQSQHDYMAVVKQGCFHHEQFKKDTSHGRL